MPVAAPPVGHCECWSVAISVEACGDYKLTIACQAKYEDREDRLNDTESEDEESTFVESHLAQILGRVL
jgi:hypothetical protein